MATRAELVTDGTERLQERRPEGAPDEPGELYAQGTQSIRVAGSCTSSHLHITRWLLPRSGLVGTRNVGYAGPVHCSTDELPRLSADEPLTDAQQRELDRRLAELEHRSA
jgi:hypothetical protein